MRRSWLLHLAPAALLVAFVVAPLVTGARTLFLRDTLVTHLSMRQGLVAPLRAGEIALVDPLRGGGQALAGNLNAVALYPDNLLLLVASPLWQLNAHFWIHWIAAFAAAFWLARTLGWGVPAAAATAVAYGASGFVVSQLNLYNGIAAVALAPALAAALLGARRGSVRSAIAFAVAWALALMGGDPILAALALVAAVAVALAQPGERAPRSWKRAAFAMLCGTLLAAPQLLLTRALLPESYRGFQGFGVADLARAAPTPAALLELFLPLFFGRPDLGVFWGEAYFGGTPPLYFSLAPGAVVLVLVIVALARGGRERRAPAVLAAAGLVLAFSAAMPLARLLAALPGMSLVRFQAKFALLLALGVALLAGLGAERLAADERARALLRRAAAAGSALYGLVVLLLAVRPAALFAPFVARFGQGLSGAALELEARRWAGVSLLTGLALLLLAIAAARRFERRDIALPVAIALQAALQLLLLRGIFPTDESAFYRTPPALARDFAPSDRVVQGASGSLFGIERSDLERADLRGRRLALQVRDAWTSGFPFALHAGGIATDLDSSPEGLDHFTLHAAESALDRLADSDRIRMLRALGTTHLLLPRALDDVPPELASLLRVDAAQTPPLSVYAMHGGPGDAAFLPCVVYAPQMNAALSRMVAPDHDPRREAVVRGDAPPRCASGGTARVVSETRESVELEIDAPEGGVVVLRRAYLPIWRAEIDGGAAPTTPAQMTRLGVEVPPGAKRLRLAVDRSPLHRGLALAAVGALALALFALRSRKRASETAPE